MGSPALPTPGTLATWVVFAVWAVFQRADQLELRARVETLELACTGSAPASTARHTAAARPFTQASVSEMANEPRVLDVPSPRPIRQLAMAPRAVPRTTLSLSVDGASGVSELVFGADDSAGRATLEHDVESSALRLVRSTGTILDVDNAGNTELGGSSSIRIHGPEIMFENRNTVTVTEIEGRASVWDRPNLQIYRGDTVVWVWTTQQNVAQADASYASIAGQPGTFYSGVPTLASTFSVRFDHVGTYYYKSQNGASLIGSVTVKEFAWRTAQEAGGNSTGTFAVGGNMVVDGNLTANGQMVRFPEEIRFFRYHVNYPTNTSARPCPPGWTQLGRPGYAGYLANNGLTEYGMTMCYQPITT